MSYQEEKLQEIANAIRVKKGQSAEPQAGTVIKATNFAQEILALPTGSDKITAKDIDGEWICTRRYIETIATGEIQDTTQDILYPEIFYFKDGKAGRYSEGNFTGVEVNEQAQRNATEYDFIIEDNIVKFYTIDGTTYGYNLSYSVINNEAVLTWKLTPGTTQTVLEFRRFLPEMKLLTGENKVTKNGTLYPSRYYAYGFANVEVDVQPKLVIKAIGQNGTYKASDDGYDGYSEITVNVQDKVTAPTGTIEITENGTYNVEEYASAEVSVEPKLQEKNVTENGEVTADAGYDGLSKVTVSVASSGTGTDMLQAMVDQAGDANYLFYNYNGTNLDFAKNLDWSKVKRAQNMCAGSKLTNIELDFKGATTDLGYAFQNAKNATTIKLLNTQNVTEMQDLCNNCAALTSATIDTSSATDTNRMFKSCSKLTNVSGLNTSNVVYMDEMFYGCSALTSIPALDTSKAARLTSVFQGCSSLTEIPPLNTGNMKIFTSAFSGCSSLTKVPDGLDMSNSNEAGSMFNGCKSLTEIPPLNTGTLVLWSSMFSGCTNLVTVHELDMNNLGSSYGSNVFNGCTNLTNLTVKNVRNNLKIGSGTSYGHLLTVDSLVNTIKELIDRGSSRTLTMGTTNTAKLADVYVKLLEDDGSGKLPCEVCESTDEGAMLITDYVGLKNWALA